MAGRRPAALIILFAAAWWAGCTRPDVDSGDTSAKAAMAFEELAVPAAPGSRTPNLLASPDGLLLSWVEPVAASEEAGGEAPHALRFARLGDGAWSEPRTIATGDDWFVNWADFPALASLGEGVLAAHFLRRSSDASPYAYDVRITRSDDAGVTWQPAVTPHRDGTPTEHGFVSMLPDGEGGLLAVWLDGRATAGGMHEGTAGPMTLRTATLAPDGSVREAAELDRRVCDCCQTSAVRLPHGLLVAYRDRAPDEVRDVAVIRRIDGRWEPPRPLHTDGWMIQGCPVNGPAASAAGARVAVAYFTAAGDVPRVKVSFSDDAGASFGMPVAVDDGAPLGRVDAVMLPEGTALVSWVEQTEDGAEVRVRRVHPDGTRGPSRTVAGTSPARASGFPRMARHGDAVYVAWTQASDPARIHTAVAALPLNGP